MKLVLQSNLCVIIPFDSKHAQLRNAISYLSKEVVILSDQKETIWCYSGQRPYLQLQLMLYPYNFPPKLELGDHKLFVKKKNVMLNNIFTFL